MVLMATGRKPYTEGLGLPALGIKMEGRAIVVNEHLETNVDGVYAIGDVLGKSMLASVASYEGEVAVENALGRSRQVDYRAVPSVVYTYPAVASVGISEKEASDRGIKYKVSKFPFLICGRAVAMDETAGIVKMICEAGNGKVLGMHIMGPHADIQLGATAKDIAHTIHAHPTLPEAVMEAAMGQLEGPIHFRRM